MVEAQTDRPFYSSIVTEHIVPQGKDFTFKRWHDRLIKQAKRHPGFLRADLCPPLRCQDPVVKWYSIVHFDSPDHLTQWMQSSDRRHLVTSGQTIFQAYRFKSFTTGLEGWFSQQTGKSEQTSLSPPPWKQILAVVVGLYPIVMLQSQLLSSLGILEGWSPAIAMLLSNLLTSSILSLIVMPFVARRLSFWLQPAYRLTSRQSDLTGLTIVVAALGMMVLLFLQL
jgi:uncharacterized protein